MAILKKSAFLSFNLSSEIFAITVTKVLEVLEIQPVTKVPQTPEYIRGVINFRGDILPVIDTRRKFNMESVADTPKTVIIVLDLVIFNKKLIVGIIADSVKDVIEISPSDVKEVPSLGSRYNSDFLEGMIKTDSGFIMILNIEKVFTADDVSLVENSTESDKD